MFQAIEIFPDGQGGYGGYNALELRAFCPVTRYGGLRISDATTLNNKQLVERASGQAWALRVFQKKTQESVYIPISGFVAEELRNIGILAAFIGELQGRGWRELFTTT